MPEFLPSVALITIVTTTINFLRHLRGQEWAGAATIFSAWVAGVIAVMIAAQTDFASGIEVGDRTLEGLNLASQIFVGLGVASAGSFLTDIKKAVDATDSAVKPSLFPPPTPKDPHA
jgi:hypothetical protein